MRTLTGDTFKEALTEVINRFSQENGSDTPDYILAEYLVDCLAKFNKAVNDREVHLGRLSNGVPGECEYNCKGAGEHTHSESAQLSSNKDTKESDGDE